MSFWKRIGLADFDTIVQMQEELFRLKEENHRLIDEKTNDITRFLESQNQDNKDILTDIQKKVSEEACSISEKTDALGSDIKKSFICETQSINDAINEHHVSLKEKNSYILDRIRQISDLYVETENKNVALLVEQIESLKKSLQISSTEVSSLKAENEELRGILEKYISDSEVTDKQIVVKIENTANSMATKINNQISDIIGHIEKLMTTIEGLGSKLLYANSLNNENTEQLLQELREHRSASMRSADLKKELDVINEDVINMWKMLKILLVESALTELDKSV